MVTMDSLESRLEKLVDIFIEAKHIDYKHPLSQETGFEPKEPIEIKELVDELVKNLDPRRPYSSLDLGCGNGEWTIMAAAAGLDSFGVDINAYLINRARFLLQLTQERNLVPQNIRVGFAVGNIYPTEFMDAYRAFAIKERYRSETMPLEFNKNPYQELGIKISDADVVYSFPWRDQMPFLCDFLELQTRQDAFFVLPHYNGEMPGKVNLKLTRLGKYIDMGFLGKRTASL